MKLTATLSMEELKKLVSGYVKKKTGKHVESVSIEDTEVIVELGTDEDDSEE